MEIVWLPTARKRMQEIIDYYLEVAGVRATLKLTNTIHNTVNKLRTLSGIGKVEPEMSNQKYVYHSIVAHRNYKVVYYVQDDVVYIFTIWDCRRDPLQMKYEDS